MKKSIFPVALVIVLVSWQCSKNINERDLSVKESIQHSVSEINKAVDKISTAGGYKLITLSEGSAAAKAGDLSGEAVKSDMEFRDSIELKLIAGIYNFSPNPEMHPGIFYPYRLFRKTGESENLEVNLPKQLVFHPGRLHMLIMADTLLDNNFKITATDYHFFYNWWNNYDYKLVSSFSLDNQDLGSMDISSLWKSPFMRRYANIFSFPDGYSLIKTGQTGDTTKVVFALAQNNDTLFKESLIFTGDGFKRREKQYILSVGNVDIKRSTGIDSIQVFLDGVLQQKAGAKIIDNTDYNASFFSRRDILLKFDDGTEAKLSALLSPSLETLRNLSRSLDEMYISKHIIDYIAFNIYYRR